MLHAVLTSVELAGASATPSASGAAGFTLVPRDGARVRVVQLMPAVAGERRELAAASAAE